jgi:hypothetical protein
MANWRGLPGVGGPALAALDGLLSPAGCPFGQCPSGHLSGAKFLCFLMAKPLRRSRFLQTPWADIMTRARYWLVNTLVWALAALCVAPIVSLIWR